MFNRLKALLHKCIPLLILIVIISSAACGEIIKRAHRVHPNLKREEVLAALGYAALVCKADVV